MFIIRYRDTATTATATTAAAAAAIVDEREGPLTAIKQIFTVDKHGIKNARAWTTATLVRCVAHTCRHIGIMGILHRYVRLRTSANGKIVDAFIILCAYHVYNNYNIIIIPTGEPDKARDVRTTRRRS